MDDIYLFNITEFRVFTQQTIKHYFELDDPNTTGFTAL